MAFNPRNVCQICNRKAPLNSVYGNHYGTLSCPGCKEFFRRTIQMYGVENMQSFYSCVSVHEGQGCDMKEFGRIHRCPSCRLFKCLICNMDPLKVKGIKI